MRVSDTRLAVSRAVRWVRVCRVCRAVWCVHAESPQPSPYPRQRAPAAYVQRVSRADSFVVCSARALCAALHGDAACRMPLARRARHPSMGSVESGAGAVALLGAVGAPMARPFREPLRQAVGECPTGHCQALHLRRPRCCRSPRLRRDRRSSRASRGSARTSRCSGAPRWVVRSQRVTCRGGCRAACHTCVVRCPHCRAKHAEGPLRSWDAGSRPSARASLRRAVGRKPGCPRAASTCRMHACPACAALVISSATLRCAAGTCRPSAHASAETASTRRSAPRPQTPTARSGWRPLRRPPRERRLRRTTRSRWWARRLYCTVSRRAASTARCG